MRETLRPLSRQLTSGKSPILLLLLLGWALRIWDWGKFPLHPDEALYGYWARLIATGRDPALFSVYVDKPPLFIYSLAGAFRTFGLSVEAARFLNIAASFLSLPLLWGIARRWYGAETAFWALGAYVLSPFAILFAPTMFTDPFLVLWVLASLWASGQGQFLLAGIAVGLAYASKQQSILFLPLVTGVLVLRAGRNWRKWAPFLGGLLPVLGLVTWWDSLRWAFRPSFWDRSIATYGGIRLVPAYHWAGKIAGWWRLLGMVYASPLVNAALAAAFLWLAVECIEKKSSRQMSLLVVAFVPAYLALHVVVNFQVWDRYLLGIVPLLALVLGRGIAATRWKWRPAVAMVVFTAVIWSMPGALAGELPVGGDHRLHEGIDRVAAYLSETAPPGSVLYHHWLGWYWDFYLYDKPVEKRYYFGPEYLARNAEKIAHRGMFLVMPAWKRVSPVREALDRDGLRLYLLKKFHRKDGSLAFTVWRIGVADDHAVCPTSPCEPDRFRG